MSKEQAIELLTNIATAIGRKVVVSDIDDSVSIPYQVLESWAYNITRVIVAIENDVSC